MKADGTSIAASRSALSGAVQARAPRCAASRLALLLASLLVGLMLLCVPSSAYAAQEPADFFGSNIGSQLSSDGSQAGEEAAERDAEALQRLGIHNVRLDFVWANIQSASCDGNTAKSAYNFAWDDRMVRHAANHNLTAIALLYGNRAGEGCDVHPYPKPGTTMYGAWKLESDEGYVWAFVQRYGFKGDFWAENPSLPYHPIRIWEVWNEENLPANDPEYTVNPQSYAHFLVDTAATIRHAQEQQSGESVAATNTKVVMGGLASEGGTYVTNYFNSIYSSPSGYTPSQFHEAFDGLGYHPYAIEGAAADSEKTLNDARAALDHSRSALNGGSDASKTLWVTELGWPVISFTRNGKTTTITESQQASYLSESFSWIYNNAEAKKIKYAAWYDYRDLAASCSEYKCWANVAGLRDLHGNYRRSWWALQERTGATPMVPVIAVVTSDGKLYVKTGSLSGAWTEESVPGVSVVNASVAADAGNGPLIAAMGANGHPYVKQGLSGPWVDEKNEAVRSVTVASDPNFGPLIGVVTNEGHALVKEGSLYAAWVDENASTQSLALASDPTNGPLIGVLTTEAHALVKEGSLYAAWVDEKNTPVASLSLASDWKNGPLIGVLTTGSTSFVKEGNLYATWVEEFGGVKSLGLASDATNGPLIGVMTSSTSHAYVKEGSLYAAWVDEIGPVQWVILGSDSYKGPLIGVLTNNNDALVKQGSLYGEWVNEFGGIATFAIAG